MYILTRYVERVHSDNGEYEISFHIYTIVGDRSVVRWFVVLIVLYGDVWGVDILFDNALSFFKWCGLNFYGSIELKRDGECVGFHIIQLKENMIINFNTVSHKYFQEIGKIICMIFSDVSLGMIYWVLVYWYIWYMYSVSYREKYWLHMVRGERWDKELFERHNDMFVTWYGIAEREEDFW